MSGANGANAEQRTYLSHPHHLPSTTDAPQTSQTHRIDVDASK